MFKTCISWSGPWMRFWVRAKWDATPPENAPLAESVHLNERKHQLQKAFVSHHVFLNFLSFLKSAPLSMVIQSLTDLPQKKARKTWKFQSVKLFPRGEHCELMGCSYYSRWQFFSRLLRFNPIWGKIPILLTKVETTNCWYSDPRPQVQLADVWSINSIIWSTPVVDRV